jgi:hypothetical protein
MTERIDILHRRHRIIAGARPSGPIAMVYDGQSRLHEASGSTVGAAVDNAKHWINQLIDSQKARRRSPHIGTTEEYLRALQAVSIGRHQEAMLRAHANAAEQLLTATELARAAGYDSYSTANAQYGRLAHEIAEFLEIEPKMIEYDGEPIWTNVLAQGDDREPIELGHLRLRLHREVLAALRELNMA